MGAKVCMINWRGLYNSDELQIQVSANSRGHSGKFDIYNIILYVCINYIDLLVDRAVKYRDL